MAAVVGAMAGQGPAVSAAGDEAGPAITEAFLQFLNGFTAPEDIASSVASGPRKTYVEQVSEMRGRDITTLAVSFEDIVSFDATLAQCIEAEYYRYEPFIRQAVQLFVRQTTPAAIAAQDEGIDREYHVALYNLPLVSHLRDLKAEKIGRLLSVSGTVTRTSEVRPELQYGAFTCISCGNTIKNVEQQFKFTEPAACTNPACQNQKVNFQLDVDGSKFIDWQRCRVQENSDEVPAGSLPRSLDVILRHETVENARAGDRCIFTGMLVAVPDVAALAATGERAEGARNIKRNGGNQGEQGVSGLRALGVRDLSYRLCFLANSVVPADRVTTGANIREEIEDEAQGGVPAMTEQEMEEVRRMRSDPRLYDNLVNSIAPSVFGATDIKRAVLLMLFGGMHKKTPEGISLRGDINVLVVGDPSCAKSQFLKYVSGFLPRAVYTSGKSSSAAGLTATVAKDTETGEFCIDAGALMLADNGICCIDEFDKMDQVDQVAIHEAMEQQTISIAKAGIQATLNARTSILAAANPSGGRYDKSKPLKYNLAMPPAILSRFDLVHVMIDEPDEVSDFSIARHIISVHQRRDEALTAPYSTASLQRYIRFARSVKPKLTDESANTLVEAYRTLRRGDATPGSQTAYRITVRQLEALVRLSEAVARVHCSNVVTRGHVNEARRLLSSSILHVDREDVTLDNDDMMGVAAEELRLEEEERDPNSVAHREEGTTPTEEEGRGGGGGEDGGTTRPAAQKISFERYQRITLQLVAKLNEYEENLGSDEDKPEEDKEEKREVSGDENEDPNEKKKGEEKEGDAIEEEAATVGGMKQEDLMRWWLEEMSSKGLYTNEAEAEADLKLLRGVIQNLIVREGILIVVDTPAGMIGERPLTADEQDERILAVNPNYVVE